MVENLRAIGFVRLHLAGVNDERRSAFAKVMKGITAKMAVDGLLNSGPEIRARLDAMRDSGADFIANAVDGIPDRYQNPETFSQVREAAEQHFEFLKASLPGFISRGLESAEGRRASAIFAGYMAEFERRLKLLGDGFGVALDGQTRPEIAPFTVAEIDDWIRSTSHTGMKKARTAFMKEERSKGLSAAFEARWNVIKQNKVGRPHANP